jgi:hypothetical protein
MKLRTSDFWVLHLQRIDRSNRSTIDDFSLHYSTTSICNNNSTTMKTSLQLLILTASANAFVPSTIGRRTVSLNLEDHIAKM